MFEIQGSVLKAFEITTTTCVQGFTAQRQRAAVADREATFKSKDEGVFFVRAGGTNDHKLLHLEESVPDIRIERIEVLPAVCVKLSTNTPPSNFEVFSRTWAEHYISFERRKADWSKIVAEYRRKVSPETTPQQLFDIFEAMIQPLGDLHSYISAPSLKRSTKEFWRAGTDRIIKGGIDEFADHGRWGLFAMIDRTYVRGTPKMYCNRHLQYGHLDTTTGYLRILSFGGYSKRNDLKALEHALDSIFSDRQLETLVIDMRLSFGGSDELGLAIASRLTATEYLAYTVQARSDPVDSDKWTPNQPIMVRPSSRPGFRGPIVVLTGPITMSAAETFIEALIGRDAPVTRIGENTQGVFCDVLGRHLPNGWSFGLPNAVYRNQAKGFDVTGIPPDIEVPVFADIDVAAGKDPAMDAATRALLNGR